MDATETEKSTVQMERNVLSACHTPEPRATTLSASQMNVEATKLSPGSEPVPTVKRDSDLMLTEEAALDHQVDD